jgi:multidrug efflux pump subunit AcrA (membrane-fusion protein)
MAEPLGVLVGLLRDVREAETPAALAFVLVNAARRLIAYDRALLLRCGAGGWRAVAASGASQIDRASPLIRRLERTAADKSFAARARTLHEMDFPPTTDDDGGPDQALGGRPLWVPLIALTGGPGGTEGGGQDDGLIGALWLDRTEPWREAEAALLTELASAAAHAFHALEGGRRRRPPVRRLALGLSVAAVLALFLPAQRAALAPVEIVARDAETVAAPIDGVIRSFEVRPNRRVEVGDALFTLDDTDRRARFEVAAKALDVARVEHRQASQGALGGKRDASKLAALEAQIALKEIELDNARQQLERTKARAGRSGVALLPDAQDYIGRPVAAGERVMQVADPREIEARAWLAAHDVLPVADGAAVRVFLDADPLRPLDGRVVRIHHEAEETPTGMAYRVMIALNPAQENAPRIGARGTARIDGDRAPLFWYLFRRPVAALRQALGF